MQIHIISLPPSITVYEFSSPYGQDEDEEEGRRKKRRNLPFGYKQQQQQIYESCSQSLPIVCNLQNYGYFLKPKLKIENFQNFY
ncbi:hypothetical protein DOY81_006995 [Sarcophaga bullata]|nr:hypothetical protein DOY81_006995 [Sarcophaga bullata]